MHESLSHHDPLDYEHRRTMSPENAERTLAMLDLIPLAQPAKIRTLVHRMGDPERMDGWLATKELTDSLGDAYDLYWGDLGLLRICLGNEHATAVFDGNEIDYIPLFGDNTELLKISRLTALLQDGGKVLSIAQTGSNTAQNFYNILVAKRVVDGIGSEHLSPTVKKAVVALVGLDVVGGMLQGHDVEEKLAQFIAQWPPELEEVREDLMLSSYLSDASAHSKYRLYRNAHNGFVEPAVREEDAQLTFLFDRHPDGALTLTPERCQLLLSRLPNIQRLRYLLTGEPAPYVRDDKAFAEAILKKTTGTRKGIITHTTHHSGGKDVTILQQKTTLGTSATIITYPRDRSDAAIESCYWLPGDGRVWRRSVWVGNMVPSDFGPHPDDYAHPNPEIARMQQRVLTADRVYASDIGQPIPPQQTWEIIRRIENMPTPKTAP